MQSNSIDHHFYHFKTNNVGLGGMMKIHSNQIEIQENKRVKERERWS